MRERIIQPQVEAVSLPRDTEVLVIGGGPAGLSAGAALRSHGGDFLVVELGRRVEYRDHEHQQDLGTGVGGSGLYSDGKFSFFPSATHLWELGDREALGRSWEWFSTKLAGFGVESPDLPHLADAAISAPVPVTGEAFERKEYRSEYLAYQLRKSLIEDLQTSCGASLHTGSRVRAVRFDPTSRLFRCTIVGDNGESSVLAARRVVFAGGRFAPLDWRDTVHGTKKASTG